VQGKGVDTIACISVNDAFVMDAWGKSVGAGDKVMMLADGNGQFAKALGVELDLNDKGLGLRSRRYALLADDQVGATPLCRGGLKCVCVGGGLVLIIGPGFAADNQYCWQMTRPACVRAGGAGK
jgi:hypothetical protein